MTASELQSQLAKHRQKSGGVPLKRSNKKPDTPSLIYDPKDAALLDANELRCRAQDGFDILVSTVDPDLASDNLFRPSPNHVSLLAKKRAFLKPGECREVDEIIDRFIYRVGGYWQDENVLHCLEYLIRQYSIHRFNVSALIAISLPFHDTSVFARLVRILVLPPDSPFLFLEAVQKKSLPLKRSVFVQNCIRNNYLLSFLGTAVMKSCAELKNPNLPLVSFFVLVSIELLADQNYVPTEKSLRQLIPYLFFALQNPSLRELHSGALCVLTQMSQRSALSHSTCTAVLQELFSGVLRSTPSLSRKQIALSEAFMFLNLLILGQTRTQQNDNSSCILIPSKTVYMFCKERHSKDVIAAIYDIISQDIDVSGLIGCLFRSIYYCMIDDTFKPTFIESVKTFVSEFIQRGTQDEKASLPLKCRTVICLTAFDAICSFNDLKPVSELLSVSLSSLEDLYPMTIASSIRNVVELPGTPSPAISHIIDSLTTFLSDSPTSPISDINHEFGSSFSIWTAISDSNSQIRLESSGVALGRLEKFFSSVDPSSTTGFPSGIRLLCQVLIDRSTDRHLPVAQLILSHNLLWSRSPPSISLTSLFQQIYHIVDCRCRDNVWTLTFTIPSKMPSDSLFVSDILIILLSSSPPRLVTRFISILKALIMVLNECPSEVIRDAFNQVAPVLLPIFWSLSKLLTHLDESLMSLYETVFNLFEIFGTHDVCNFSRLKAPEKRKSRKTNDDKILSNDSIKASLLSTLVPASVDSLNWKLGPVYVISLSHDGEKCPIVRASTGGHLGGVWSFVSCLEAIDGTEEPEVLEKLMSIAHNLWSNAVDYNRHPNSNCEGFILCHQTIRHFVRSIIKGQFPKDNKTTSPLYKSVLQLSLCDVLDDQELISLFSLPSIVPLMGLFVAGCDLQNSIMLETIRLSSVRILKSIIDGAVDWIRFLTAPLLIGLTDVNPSMRLACLDLIKSIRKSNNTLSSSDPSLWQCFIKIPSSTQIKETFESFPLRPFFKSITTNSSEIAVDAASAVSVLRSVIASSSSSVAFVGSLSVLICSSSTAGSQLLLRFLDGVHVTTLSNVFCVSVWRSYLLEHDCHDDGLSLVCQYLASALEKSKPINDDQRSSLELFVKAVSAKILLPFCKLNPDYTSVMSCHHRYQQFLVLVESLMMSESFPLLGNSSSLLRSLIKSSVRWIAPKKSEDNHREDNHREDNHREDNHREDNYREDNYREDNHREDNHREDNHREDNYREDNHREVKLPGKTLSSLLRDVGSMVILPNAWIEQLREDPKDIRKLTLIASCLEISLDKKQPDWSSSLCIDLMEILIERLSLLVREKDEDIFKFPAIKSILRCLPKCVIGEFDNRQIQSKIVPLVKLCIERCAVMTTKKVKKTDDDRSEEIIGPLLLMIKDFSIRWDMKINEEKNEETNAGVEMDEVFNQFINEILKPVIQNNGRLLLSPNISTTLQRSIPDIIHACHDRNDSSSRLRRSLIWIQGMAAVIVKQHVPRCYSTTGTELNDRRSKKEAELLEKKILVLSNAMNDEPNGLSVLLFNVIQLWSLEVQAMGQKLAKSVESSEEEEDKEKSDSPVVTSDRWIINLIVNVITKLSDSSIRHDVIRNLCVMVYTELLSYNKSENKKTRIVEECSQINIINIFKKYPPWTDDIENKRQSSTLRSKCLFLNCSVIRQYLRISGSPTLNDPEGIGEDKTRNNSNYGVDIKYQCSIEAQQLTQLIEIFLLISSLFQKMSRVSSHLLPLRTLIRKTSNELIQNVDILLGVCQIIHQTFAEHVHPNIVSDLLSLIQLSLFTPRLTTALQIPKSRNEQSKKRKTTQDNKTDNELLTPLFVRESNSALKSEMFIASTVSLLAGFYSDENSSILSALFISDLILISGNVLPSVFQSGWIAKLPDHFGSMFQKLSESINDQDDNQGVFKSYEPLCYALCRNVFSICKSIPNHFYIPSLNPLVDNILKLLSYLSNLSSNPLLHSVTLALSSLLSLPSRHFMTHHLTALINLIINPSIIINYILPYSSDIFMSPCRIFKSMTVPKPFLSMRAFQNAIANYWNYKSVNSNFDLSSLHSLWRQLFYLIAKQTPFRIMILALHSSVKQLSNDVMASINDNSLICPALHFGSYLTLLSISLGGNTPETVALHHKEISNLLLTAVHTAHSHVELITKNNKTSVECLSKETQSGIVEELRKDRKHCNEVSVIDLSNKSNLQSDLKSRTFGLLESGIWLAFRAWIPKMTNSHLQPFIKIMLKYCRRGRRLVLSHELDNSDDKQPITDGDAVCARMFITIISAVVLELGDLGITGCLVDIIPDINQIISSSIQNAFQLSLNNRQNIELNLGSTTSKSKKRALSHQSLSTSWWWCDVIIPSLCCLESCAEALTSNSSDSTPQLNISLVDGTISSVVNTLDLFALVDPLPMNMSDDNEDDDACKYSLGLGVLISCQNSICSLIKCVLGDQLKVNDILRRLLEKMQTTANSSVRIATVRVVSYLWKTLTVSLLPTLSDSLQVFVELLEDHDDDVEIATRKLLTIIEGITGESLSSRLRH